VHSGGKWSETSSNALLILLLQDRCPQDLGFVTVSLWAAVSQAIMGATRHFVDYDIRLNCS
jgi:hypothetical protein